MLRGKGENVSIEERYNSAKGVPWSWEVVRLKSCKNGARPGVCGSACKNEKEIFREGHMQGSGLNGLKIK